MNIKVKAVWYLYIKPIDTALLTPELKKILSDYTDSYLHTKGAVCWVKSGDIYALKITLEQKNHAVDF